ncbi:hypothetical protein FOL46_002425 [Perkinsus olseni]|uniref:C3H1-type domain-containing protein n=1 Tax=Perkinsus olseni TaxID=32597 RepID=A0A7J6M7T8_PEROL|nr:hypothetical protein FOL46_002425 [Perkinsus olseni]
MSIPTGVCSGSETAERQRTGADGRGEDSKGRSIAEGAAAQKPLCGYYKKDRCRLGQMCRFAHSLHEHANPRLITMRRATTRSARRKRGSSSTASVTSSCDAASTADEYTTSAGDVSSAVFDESVIASIPGDEFGVPGFGESSQAMTMACPGYYMTNACYSSTSTCAAGCYDIPSFSMVEHGLYIPRRRAEVESCPVRPLPIECSDSRRHLPPFPYAATVEELAACAPDHYED